MAVENFNDGNWTENDPNGHVAIASDTRCTFTAMHRAEEARIYKDMTADFFDGDFEHLLEAYWTEGQEYYEHGPFWALANIVDDEGACNANANGHLETFFYYNASFQQINCHAYSGGSQDDTDAWTSCNTATLYYLKIKRDEAVGTYGHLYVYIYSNSNRTTLLDTLDVTLGEKTDFRYAYAVQADASSNSDRWITGYIQNLDFQVAGGSGVTITATTAAVVVASVDTTISEGISFTATTAAVVLAGVDATISAGTTIVADTAAVSIVGIDASISEGILIEATTGSVVITSVDATISGRSTYADTSTNIINLASKIQFEFNLLETIQTQFCIATPPQFSFEAEVFDFEYDISLAESSYYVAA